MDAADLALARHRLYALLGQLIVEGPSAGPLALARQLPAIASALAGDPEALAASHHAAFAHELSPHEGVILGEEGLLGGSIASAVREMYDDAGAAPGLRDVEPDHLGLELAFLANLAATEARTASSVATSGAPPAPNVPGADPAIGDLTARFLDEHLLRWLPIVSVALESLAQPWAPVVALALELATAHRSDLSAPRRAWALPSGSLALDSPDTGLKTIAGFLTRPARSGWLATSGAVARVSRTAGVPAGFGGRTDRLTAAVYAAADQRRLPELVAALDTEVAAQHQALGRLGAELELTVELAPWRARQEQTRALLQQLATLAHEGTSRT